MGCMVSAASIVLLPTATVLATVIAFLKKSLRFIYFSIYHIGKIILKIANYFVIF
jgi:hypothetical protein